MTLALVNDVLAQGVRLSVVCQRLGVSARTVQRWRKPETAEDGRCGPRQQPANRLTQAERRHLLAVANSKEFRDLSPQQIVPILADRGQYVASESSFYRVLREAKQLAHRGRAKPRTVRTRTEHLASRPCQVWSWDISYLRGPVRGPSSSCTWCWTCSAAASWGGTSMRKSPWTFPSPSSAAPASRTRWTLPASSSTPTMAAP